MQRRALIQALGGAAATLGVPSLFAQEWPNAPVRIIVGFPPGGGTDALARVVAQKLTVMWNQQVIVENKGGVAGVLAAEYVAQQPSDGSTLLMAHINSHALAPSLQPKLRYSVERDFVPIVMVGVTPNLLIAHPGQPAKTVAEIVALCKATSSRPIIPRASCATPAASNTSITLTQHLRPRATSSRTHRGRG